MWLLGHFGLGYIAAYLTYSVTGEPFILPVVLFLSIAPDIDELTRRIMVHRGPTHSLFTITLAYVALAITFGFGLPYYAALVSHLLADYLVPPCKLFWPLTNKWIGAPGWLQLSGRAETMVELLLFTSLISILFL